MTPISLQLKHPLRQPAPTFGAAVKGAGELATIEEFRNTVRTTAQKSGELVFQPAGAPRPETFMSRSLNRMKWGLLVLAGIGASVGGLTMGRWSKASYEAAKPSATTVAQDKLLQPDWQMLKGKFHALEATRTNGKADPQLVTEFYDQMEAMMIKLVGSLKQYPSDALDTVLLEKIEKNSDFMPWKKAAPVSQKFSNYMISELEKQGTTPMAARLSQINNIDILNGFVNERPEFQFLSGSQKADLAKALHDKFQDQWQECQSKAEQFRDFTYFTESYFRATVVNNIGTGFDGLNLDAVKQVKTREDAQALFTKVVSNSRNYKSFTAGERDAFLKRGNEILGSLDHYTPPLAWAAAAWLLIIAGSLGTAGLVLLQGKKLLELLPGSVDFLKGMTRPTVFVDKDNLANPEAQGQLAVMTGQIKAIATEMATVMRDSYRNSPEVRELLSQRYKTEDSLPDAEQMMAQYVFNTLQASQKSMGLSSRVTEAADSELAFTQKVLSRIEQAFNNDTYVLEGLPEGMMVPQQKPDPSKAKDELEWLQLERAALRHDLQENRKHLVNRIFGAARASDVARKLETDLVSLFDQAFPKEASFPTDKKLVVLKSVSEGGTASDFKPQISAKYQEYAKAQEKLTERTEMLRLTKLAIGKNLASVQNYISALEDIMARKQATAEVKAFSDIQKDLKTSLEDPTLKKLIEQEELQKLMDQNDAEQAAEQKRFMEKVEAVLRATSGNEVATNAVAVNTQGNH